MNIANNILIPEIGRLIQDGHTVTILVKGFSMRPFVEHCRDHVVLGISKEVSVNDVVLAKVDDRYVLHRIICKNGDSLTLQGDGVLLATEHCLTSDVVAKAIAFIRKGRKRADHTDGLKWKTYSFFWLHLTFMRRFLLAFYSHIWLRFFERNNYNNENKG
jgi:hypothetical protein